MRAVFINGEPRAIRGQFEKGPTRFQEINGLEPKAIDHRRRMRTLFRDAPAHFELMRFIVDPPGDMMNATRPPRTASGRRHLSNIDILPGRTRFRLSGTCSLQRA